MSGGLALFCIGTMLCALAPTFVLFLIGYGLIGLSGALYQPAAQAYLSARTPYARRGWVLGVYETSWAFAALFGIAPLLYVVQTTGDSAPVFWLLFGAGVFSYVMIPYALPPAATPGGGVQQRLDWSALRRPGVLAMLGLLSLSMAAADLIFVVQGAWLKTSFGANEAQIGQVFGMLGIAELLGAVGAIMLVDRVGKKRAVIGGFLATALCLAVLPWSDGSWTLFLLLFFLFDVCFEFAVVSSAPFASGIAPTMRGTVLALCVVANGVGRLGGSLVSEPLWRNYGISANGLLAAALMCVGVALCACFTRETEQ
jgi:predicted MFS family arabinose efflux permease